MLPIPDAAALSPTAIELAAAVVPPAFADLPIAIDASPDALPDAPANESSPVAFEFVPTAVLLVFVAYEAAPRAME